VIANRWPVFLVTLWVPALIMVLRPVRAAEPGPIPLRGTE
jgi:hypothetical protein